MKLSYYPGCSLKGSAADYDDSLHRLCAHLDIDLVELVDWNCCGASSAHMLNHEAGMRLAMRTLQQAAGIGHDLLVPCAACFQRLKAADRALRRDAEYWDEPDYSPAWQVIHISSLLAAPELLARIKKAVSRPLTGLKLACYYGCLSLRPPKVTAAENWEQPDTLERLVAAIGAEPVRWSHRTECCSGSLTMARPDIAERLVADIVAAAARAGAEALVTDCPMCQANVESRQPAGTGLPVFYSSELAEAAISGSYPSRQRRAHLVDPGVLSRLLATAQAVEGGAR